MCTGREGACQSFREAGFGDTQNIIKVTLMKTLKTFAAVVLAGAGLLGATQAGAVSVTFNSVGETQTVTLTCVGGASDCSTTTSTLSATFEIKLVTLGATSATFEIKITNNSTVGGQGGDRLTAFSFVNVTPNLTGCASASSGWDATCGVNAGGGFNPVELCVWDGQNCNGGSNQGVFGAGGTETITLSMNFVSGVPPITFDTFVAKFQTGQGSFHISDGGDGGDGDVPEPGTLALLGLGLLGLGFGARRKRV